MRVRVKRWVGGIYITFALSELPDMFLVSIFSIGIPILSFRQTRSTLSILATRSIVKLAP